MKNESPNLKEPAVHSSISVHEILMMNSTELESEEDLNVCMSIINEDDHPTDRESKCFVPSYWSANVTSEVTPALEDELQYYHVDSLAAPSWFLHCRVSGQPVSLLVDSGSEVTVMKTGVYLNLPDEDKPELVQHNAVIAGIGGKILVRRAAEVMYKVGSVNRACRTLLADIKCDGILGMNFLKDHSCVMAMKEGILKIGDREIQLHRVTPTELGHLVAAETVTILPMCEMLIPVKQKYGNPRVGICMSGETTKFALEDGLLIGPGVIDLSRTINPLAIANTGDEPIHLLKNTVLAGCAEINDVTNTCASGETSEVECSVAVTQAAESTFDPEQELPAYLEIMLKDTELPDSDKIKARTLIYEFRNVFAEPDAPLGRTDVTKHDIHTGDHPPIKQRARRAPQLQQDIIDIEIAKMLENNVIKPSQSPWGAPIVLVKKKDGTTRFCVDYRKLNDISTKDAYPLPNIEETFDSLNGASMFCSLDLASGFWQVEMNETSAAKTAFVTRNGLFQFKVMPFGLCNAPATFERLMEIILRGLLWKGSMVYIDDIICYGKSFEETNKHLKEVLMRISKANLKLKPKKCELFKKRLLFLGFIVDEHGIRCDPSKVEAVKKWPPPTDVGELRSFVGFASYHRRFIKGFAQIAAPMIKLTRKTEPYIWGEEQETSFRTLQKALMTAPVLVHPTRDDAFVLDTDASAKAMGGEISQIQDGVERVIAYASSSFSKEERNYCTTKRELLAVIRMMEKFRHYLWGRHFTVRTDHGSLRWLSNFKDSDGMLARWLVRLGQYDYEIIHREGAKHLNADGLSRCKQCGYSDCPDEPPPVKIRTVVSEQKSALETRSQDGRKDVVDFVEKGRTEYESAAASESRSINELDGNLQRHMLHYKTEQLREMQTQDNEIGPVISLLEESREPPSLEKICTLSADSQQMIGRWSRLKLYEGTLYYIMPESSEPNHTRLVVPAKLRIEILNNLHGLRISGHMGIARTIARVKYRFYWPGLSADVARWCAMCAICASRKGKPPPKRAPMESQPVGRAFERIAIDILDTRKVTNKGNQYILVIYDYFTKWMDAFALKRHTAQIVAEVIVKRFVLYHGIPTRIHSDQGREFESELFSHLLKMLDIEKTRTAPYRAQSNGAVERVNRTILNMLSAYTNVRALDWDEHLCYITMAYRSSVHATTGCTPFSMVYGREMTLPVDLMYPSAKDLGDVPQCGPEYVEWVRRAISSAHMFARSHLKKAAVRQKRGYDSRAKIREPLPVGSLVRYYYPPTLQKSKFAQPWLGPYRVTRRCTTMDYQITLVSDPTKRRVVHFDTLKPFEGEDEESTEMLTEVPEVIEFIDAGESYLHDPASLWDYQVPHEENTVNENPIPGLLVPQPVPDLSSVNRRSQRDRKAPQRFGRN